MDSIIIETNTQIISDVIEEMKMMLIMMGAFGFLVMAAIAIIGTAVIIQGINQIYDSEDPGDIFGKDR